VHVLVGDLDDLTRDDRATKEEDLAASSLLWAADVKAARKVVGT
jgi:hypothetical protein